MDLFPIVNFSILRIKLLMEVYELQAVVTLP